MLRDVNIILDSFSHETTDISIINAWIYDLCAR